MPENNSILEKLDGLESRYEEVSTLITDPSVIADQQRYVRLTKEYKDRYIKLRINSELVLCDDIVIRYRYARTLVDFLEIHYAATNFFILQICKNDIILVKVFKKKINGF